MHDGIRNSTAKLMREVCHHVVTEPALQPLTSEWLHPASANISEAARLDVNANGFWDCDQQSAFLYVRKFNLTAHACHHGSLSLCYKRHELEKKTTIWGFYRWSLVGLLLSFFQSLMVPVLLLLSHSSTWHLSWQPSRTLNIVRSCRRSNVGSVSLLFTLPSCVSGAHDHIKPPFNLTHIHVTSSSLSLKIRLLFNLFPYLLGATFLCLLWPNLRFIFLCSFTVTSTCNVTSWMSLFYRFIHMLKINK